MALVHIFIHRQNRTAASCGCIMTTSRCLALMFLVTFSYAALPLPSYIKPCARDAPDLDACVLEHGKAAIPTIVKGDRKYEIPSLDPAEITQIDASTGPFNLIAKNVKIYGFKDTELKGAHIDFKNQLHHYEIFFPVLNIIGDYEINGKILLLPVTGSGKLNVTTDNVNTVADIYMKVVEKEGEKYLQQQNMDLKLEPQRVHFQFTNLFNGDKLLGEELNSLLNREWKDAFNELSPPVLEAAKTVISNVITNFVEKVPYDTMFPEKV